MATAKDATTTPTITDQGADDVVNTVIERS